MENKYLVELDAKEEIIKNIEKSVVFPVQKVEEVRWEPEMEKFEDVVEGDTMEVAAEVELPACSSEIIGMPDIANEQQQSSEPVSSASLGICNLKLSCNSIGYKHVLDSESNKLSHDSSAEYPRKDDFLISDDESEVTNISLREDFFLAEEVVNKDSYSIDIHNELEAVHSKPLPFREMNSLPLKKRKGYSYNSCIKDKHYEMSYPSTPMISIAELELAKELCRFNSLNVNHPSVNSGGRMSLVTNYSIHPGYSNIAVDNFDSVIMETDCKIMASEEDLVPERLTPTLVTEHQEEQMIKSETPSQLRTFQHLSAAEDLLYFTHSSQTYIENQ